MCAWCSKQRSDTSKNNFCILLDMSKLILDPLNALEHSYEFESEQDDSDQRSALEQGVILILGYSCLRKHAFLNFLNVLLYDVQPIPTRDEPFLRIASIRLGRSRVGTL